MHIVSALIFQATVVYFPKLAAIKAGSLVLLFMWQLKIQTGQKEDNHGTKSLELPKS